MDIKVRVNKNDNYIFKLCSWDAPTFENSQALTIQSDNFNLLKEAFTTITNIEIFIADNPVGEYNIFDSFSSMTYLGRVFVAHENIFTDAIEVTLVKTNIAEQVKRIQEQLDDTIDIDAMTVDEYRDYLLGLISKQCQQEIYDGDYIEISSGTKKFTYKAEDQANIQSAFNILMIVPDLEYVPYHASKDNCYLMPSKDMLKIFMTLQLKLTYLITRCNQFNMWIRSINSKEELMQITWESELPQAFQENLANIYNYSIYIMQKVSEKIINSSNNVDSNTDLNTSTNNDTIVEDNSENSDSNNIDNNIEINTDNNTDGNTDNNTDENINENTDDNIDENIEDNTDENIEDNTDDNTDNNTNGNIEDNTEISIDEETTNESNPEQN